MLYHFRPGHRVIARSKVTSASVGDMDATTMFWRGTPDHVREHGGDLTRRLTDELTSLSEYQRACREAGDHAVVIDTRVSMIQAPGWYPSIPGWHGDAVPRSEEGQPDVGACDPRVKHFLILVSTKEDGVSSTEFLCDRVDIDVDPENVWGSVDAHLRVRENRTQRCRASRWYMFDQTALHRATPATSTGWRLFYRASVLPSSHPAAQDPTVNVVRRHSQVYMDINNAGW